MAYPETRSVNIDTSNIDLYGTPIADFCTQLLEAIATIPEEFKDSATIEINGNEDYAELSIYYERPQTDEERAQYENQQAMSRKYRLQQYLNLKAELADEIAAYEAAPENSS